ncbi:putative single-stranded DNA binding protein [Erwinia phage Fifi44]|uniref:Single-stranded DNA binding protein n=1 Tax=Erwinia phage Fifi44 TaxID=2876597 RepID=A0AAE8Y1H6_9CAUD|nr:putative single-stranded DNA binding protein [Erwinia phage Fifi44]QQV88316.1 putative single-stranded DNA binding protein [Erwinia phage pEa_SNUABM_27]UCR74881.1 putative single-stranded DNA binding protein [Erwinia phage Fifi44]UCR80885.1 hypothetical protein Fifi451_00065 [Erwinia phage Fifi451]
MSNTKTYDDTNTGIIGANDYKQKDTHPDQRGRCNVGGLWYWVSGWDKKSNNRTFTSLAFTLMTQDEVDKMMAKRAEKERPQQGAQQQQPQQQAPAQSQPQQQAPAQQTPPATQNNEPPMDFDDDIPF